MKWLKVALLMLFSLKPLLIMAAPNDISHEEQVQISPAVIKFFQQIENLMNRRYEGEIKEFFSFYAKPDAMFVKHSVLVDEDNQVLEEENMTMNREQYIKSLITILKQPRQYRASITVVSEKHSDSSNQLRNVTVSIKEIADRNQVTINVLATCNYLVEYKNRDLYIISASCSETITKQ
jgi:hypothetical protein